ncbi:MAG: amidohydrolase family protein [Balneolales bacterium]
MIKMKTVISGLTGAFIVLIVLAGCSSTTTSDERTGILFRDIHVIDAAGGLRTGQSVLVSGNRIVEVGMTGDINAPEGARIVEGNGKYMIPGLWEAHGHLTNTREMRAAMFPLLIVNGITYFRDTSASLDKIRPFLEQAGETAMQGRAPRVFISGPHIEGSQISWDSSVSVVSTDQVEPALGRLFDFGIDEIKLYDLLSPDVFYEVLSQAGSKGYNVSAHVPMAMDVVEASNAGLSSMEHMGNLEFSLSSDWDSLRTARQQMIADGAGKSGRELRGEIYRAQRLHAFQTQDAQRRETVFGALAANNTWQVPTLTLLTRADHNLFTTSEWRKTFRYLPESVRADWEEAALSQRDQTPSEEALAHARWAYDVVPGLAEAGVGIMAGTDMPLFLQTPGFSLHKELELLVRAGLTPLQAIEAATLHPAQYFGLEDSQGSIAAGMLADLVILDANPLDDITNTQRIHAVVRDGHLHAREELDRMLEQLQNK